MKLYKKTFTICLIAFIVDFIASIFFEFCSGIKNITAFSFINTYLIGIACSLIVVVITAYLQLRFEQNKLFNEILSNIGHFYFHYLLFVIRLSDEGTNKKILSECIAEIDKDISTIIKQLNEICWFSKKRNHDFLNIQQEFMLISINLCHGGNLSKETYNYFEELKGKNYSIQKIKDIILKYAPDNCYEQKSIPDYYKQIDEILNNSSQ